MIASFLWHVPNACSEHHFPHQTGDTPIAATILSSMYVFGQPMGMAPYMCKFHSHCVMLVSSSSTSFFLFFWYQHAPLCP